MCWDARVSMQTFLVGIIAIAVGLSTQTITPEYALLAGSVITIQALEAGLWTYLQDPVANHWLTIGITITLAVQPLFSMGMNYREYPMLTVAVCIGYLLFGVYRFSSDWNPNAPFVDGWKSYPGKNGHLVWNPTSYQRLDPWLLGSYLLLLFGGLLLYQEWATFVITAITFVYSVYAFGRYDTWGSMWCWTGNMISLYIIVRTLLRRTV